MTSLDELRGEVPAWCPGCGNFGILKAFKEAIVELGLEPYQFTIVSGIGQAGKFPHYLKCNTFNGLHGRTLPVATGIKLANHAMHVFAVAGEGDCYGQPSPTRTEGVVTKNQPFGVFSEQMNPMALAVAHDCSFAARAFSGDGEHLKMIIREAVQHEGFSLVDILQPCVTFNRVNTYQWYKKRVYKLEPEYNPEDRAEAFKKALEWGDRIPLGIIYRNNRPALEKRVPVLGQGPLVKRSFDPVRVEKTLEEFF